VRDKAGEEGYIVAAGAVGRTAGAAEPIADTGAEQADTDGAAVAGRMAAADEYAAHNAWAAELPWVTVLHMVRVAAVFVYFVLCRTYHKILSPPLMYIHNSYNS